MIPFLYSIWHHTRLHAVITVNFQTYTELFNNSIQFKKKIGKKTYYQLILVIYKYIYTRDTAVQNEIVNRWMRKHKKTYTNRHKLSHERMQ